MEHFADTITNLSFDGQSLRIEFAVTRMDEMKPNAAVTGRRYPACRVVLPPVTAVDLINKMQQFAAALTQAGVVKQTPAAAKPKSRGQITAFCRHDEPRWLSQMRPIDTARGRE